MVKDYIHKKCQILEVKADGNLSCQCQVNDLSIKMNTANALLFKIRKYVCPTILKPIYCTVLSPTYLTALFTGIRILNYSIDCNVAKNRLVKLGKV